MTLTSLFVMSFNMMYLGTIAVGLVSAIAFLASIGVTCGLVLYEDPWALRIVKGSFTILILLTISSVLLLYINQFKFVSSILISALWSALFLIFLLRKKSWSGNGHVSSKKASGNFIKWPMAGIFCDVLVVLFFMLFTSRTTEPTIGVWNSIPIVPFLVLLFSCSLMIASLILFRDNSHFPLLMIFGISILIEGVYYLIWYPSLYGDPLTTLGQARYVDRTGVIFDWKFLFTNRQWIDIVKGRGFPNLVAQLARMLNFDIYWVYNIVGPTLWAIIVPVSLYDISCLLMNEKPSSYPKEALFSAFAGAMLVPILIIWGANPTGNTMGFLFLFFSIPLILNWVLQGGRIRWVLAFSAVLASFMTHPMPGIFGFAFLYGATIFRKVSNNYERVIGFCISALLLPLALVFAGSQFLPTTVASVQSVLSFENTVLTFSMLLSFAGLFLALKFRKMNRQVLLLLVSFYVIVVADFYISQYGLTDVAYGAERSMVIAEFIFVPFIGLLISTLPKLFETGKSALKSSVGHSLNSKSVFAVVLILLISLQATISIYQAFPLNEVGTAPTAYEMDAVYYISSSADRRFVVVSDTLFSNLAIGLLGTDWGYLGEYQKGSFGYPDWSFSIQEDFLSMVKQPSLKTLNDAMDYAFAQEAYFVISVRNSAFNETVQKMQDMLPIDRIFGNGKLYIFKYPVPAFQGEGPSVKLTYDSGASTEEIKSEYFYIIKTYDTYFIETTGHSSYNVTDYPQYWVFKNATVNNTYRAYDNSSDINDFIVLKGLNPSDTLRIYWTANDEYPVCGWKDDSFLKGWAPYPAYSYKLDPTIKTDDGILDLSANFGEGGSGAEDFYYARAMNDSVSTDSYPYLLIRWRSFGQVAVSYVYFDDGSNQEILAFGSFNPYWSVAIVNLAPGKRISYVMVGLSNTRNIVDIKGVQTIEIDYILLCNKAP